MHNYFLVITFVELPSLKDAIKSEFFLLRNSQSLKCTDVKVDCSAGEMMKKVKVPSSLRTSLVPEVYAVEGKN